MRCDTATRSSMATPQSMQEQTSGQMNWFDQQFTQIGWPMLLALVLLFSVLMWIFSGLALLMTRTPVARRKATIVFVLCCGYLIFAGIMIYVLKNNPDF